MEITRDSVEESIRWGVLRQVNDPRLEGAIYYVTAEGVVISWNRHHPKKVEAKKGKGGVLKVTLARKKGYITLELAEMIAIAFIGPRPSDLHRLESKDGDPFNIAPENLVWAGDVRTEHIRNQPSTAAHPNQLKTRPSEPMRIASEIEEHTKPFGSNEDTDNEIVAFDQAEAELTLLRQKLARLETALRPFADFILPSSLTDRGEDKVVIEVNRDTERHCAITVSDFNTARALIGDAN